MQRIRSRDQVYSLRIMRIRYFMINKCINLNKVLIRDIEEGQSETVLKWVSIQTDKDVGIITTDRDRETKTLGLTENMGFKLMDLKTSSTGGSLTKKTNFNIKIKRTIILKEEIILITSKTNLLLIETHII